MAALEPEHLAFGASFARFLERIPVDVQLLSQAGQQGMLGIQVSEDVGGGGSDDPRFLAVALRELGRGGRIGQATSYAAQAAIALPFLDLYAPKEFRMARLPRLVDGTGIVAPVLGSVAASAEGDSWVLTGDAVGMANAATAEVLLVGLNRPDGSSGVAILDADRPEVSRVVDRCDALTGSAAATVSLRGVRVDAGYITDGLGADQLRGDYQLWTAVIAAEAARAVVEWTVSYVRERRVFGTVVAAFENTQIALARIDAELRVLAVALDCLLRQRSGSPIAVAETAAACQTASELFGRTADQGMQLHGGYGYMREYPISGAFADARLLQLRTSAAVQPLTTLSTALGLLEAARQ